MVSALLRTKEDTSGVDPSTSLSLTLMSDYHSHVIAGVPVKHGWIDNRGKSCNIIDHGCYLMMC